MDVDDLISSLPPGYLENFGVSSGTQCASIADSSELAELKPENDDSRSLTEESEADNKPGTSGVDESVNFEIFRLESSNSEERQKQLTNIAEAAEKLLPRGFTLDSVNVVTRQPFLLKHELREYQRVGLDWLVTLYDKKLNGILADEMGLGKTIQTIALLAYLACEKSNWGPHLIVVPTTVLLNWEMECKKWCPAFKILTYYGSIKERKEKRKVNFIILWLEFGRNQAQNIKNFKSLRWQMLLNFRTERRLLLTGTPLQNSLMELWSLMHFLMPHIFGSHKDFREWFSNPLTGMIEGSQEYNEQTVKRLHKNLQRHNLLERENSNRFIYQSLCELSRIDKLTKTALEEEPSVPVVVGFSLNEFYTNAAIGHGHKSDRVTKRLQFVLPTNVAGNMDLRQPFFLQMGTPSGIKFIPIKLDSQTTQNANSMTQQNATTSSATAVDSQSKSNDASSQTKEPIVLKLIPQNSAQRHQQVMTFQAAPTVQSGVNLLSSNVPKLLNQIWPDSKKHCDLPVTDKKKLNQMFPGMAVITTKTHLHPKMTDNANYRTTTTNFVPSIGGTGHRVTVHDIIPRTPTVCVFDPKKAQENSQTSKASVPPTSPPKRSLASVVSIISQHVDEAKPSTSCNMGSAFELTSLKRKKVERMVSNFLRVLTENQRRCKETKPVYGENLRRLCCISKTSPLDQFVTSLEQRFESSKPILDRFIVAVPAVKSTSPIALNISKMIDADRKSQENLLNCLKQALHPLLDLLEPVASSLAIQFPELRLIEYDCGNKQSHSNAFTVNLFEKK
uniref:Helicase ATP-binding domain-containing protein n=1 Tax=Romanomermis culicivorax TaxID=13658 RepID=A0A915KSR5_ROMCU